MSAPLLQVDHLGLDLPVRGEHRTVLRDVSFTVGAGEAVGLVGESGSGKSMTVRAIDRILPKGAVQRGTVCFDGQDVGALSGTALRTYRAEVAVVFQDPRVHINPVRRVGDFMTEVLRTNRGVGRREAAERAVAMLARVGIPDGERRLGQFPHELSGGLLQRVMIASALLTEPRLLLADEPTTALDVTTQAEIMGLLDELRRDLGLSILFITHDLDLAAACCDRTAVMYAGEIVELRASRLLHDDPLHPYTAALAAARPLLDRRMEELAAIPGRPLSALEAPAGACAFAARCPHREDACTASAPGLVEIDSGAARCLRADALRGVLGGAPHVRH
ncbi:oligopeptide/dipeptide ABC transporter ATP-binding protein [Nocardioides aromaticivorans]|uniref:Oligopeptide/dipeptide ABC transporter ATP-binding protein n=1 Tax=Nocardioides aromaticivorans TaxID=200618 RepID=A0A7Z0CPA6_9ACTN|nr:ABC transporter ATP-binding protein [Nocardioides aromaticivorans]NYI45720.1 oligopeptide/dipeptide ABC transporter ATP-binding protein [Nocardioides aromaticivorans]